MNEIKIDKDDKIEVPKWDIALEALAADESEKLGRGLTLDDFTRLAGEYSIRLDDILITMFELVVHGEWTYDGPQSPITRDKLDRLYVGGRLHAADVREYAGEWRPLS